MKRIPFGQEIKMQIVASQCPGCNTSHGHLHEYGCPVESCPKCGGMLLKCTCKALDIIDGMKIARAIADGITDKKEIHRALAQGSKHLDQSYYEEGVMLWIMEDVTARDPEAAKKADELVKDMGFRRSGNGYAISAEDVAKNMGISVDEAHEVLSDLQAESICPGRNRYDGTVQ
ncbi:MAG: hypothetical protein ACD_75C02623G0003 [uncultured bacterium]|nr:MAG: hypothetical protein ACD_75C02623G0003 [uncultured bacterium]